MFSGCSALSRVKLSPEFTYLQSGTFNDCSSLTSFTIPHTTTKIDTSTFDGGERLCEIRGYKGTTAETYSKNKGISFAGLDPEIILSHSKALLYATGGFNKLTLGVKRNGISANITFSSSKKSVATVNSAGYDHDICQSGNSLF